MTAPTTFDPIAVRQQAIAARKEMLARHAPKRAPVHVNPANVDVRRVLKHPHAGPFPASGAALWPRDRFTRRRLFDKSITLQDAQAGAQSQAPQAPQPHLATTHRDQ